MTKKTIEETMLAESIIRTNEKIYNYRTAQWEIQHICSIFEREELFVPAYQRNYVWKPELKSKFIESLFLNVPIPYIFVCENFEEGNMEIIDGYQRIKTMSDFISNEIKLSKLDKLKELNGFRFSDFSEVRQKLFLRKIMNVVIFEELEFSQKQEMFSRINTTSENLNSAELRKGIIGGEFYKFMRELSKLDSFVKLCPISPNKLKREENIELILRFFAYTENFENYKGRVDIFLTDYMKSKEDELKDKDSMKSVLNNMKDSFVKMLTFVDKNFDYGFRKTGNDKFASSRVYFEAISVGVGLSLKEKEPDALNSLIIPKLLKNDIFKEIIRSDAANNQSKFRLRINAVKNALLDGQLPIKSDGLGMI